MLIDEFDYDLPQELVAQQPLDQRDYSRLMVLNRKAQTIDHKHFYDIKSYIKPDDCLVLNSSKVIPARLYGAKIGSEAKVEFLLLKKIEGDKWETLVRPGKRLKPGDRVFFSETPHLEAEILDIGDDGTRIVQFFYEGNFSEILWALGKMPLPPYIQRPSTDEDQKRYQTVYCDEEGSVAAPTAGLHFTQELLDEIKRQGTKVVSLTLHVGIGTFRPVKCQQIEDHKMHFEEYSISKEVADIINETKAAGGRIISVGTTSARTLESAALFDEAKKSWWIPSGSGSTGIFIYPGYKFKMVDNLITNFHLPKSTLLMLVSALYDRNNILAAYKEAIEEEYRFFSYGDAMFIE